LPPPKKTKAATNAIDLVSVLQQSIGRAKRGQTFRVNGRKSKNRLQLN